MKNILFQGDSITDCCRDRDNDFFKGHGYATIVAGRLSYAHAGELNFYNRGISGNRIVDLYARIKSDAINLKPDIMTVLCGVNDVWHELERQNGVAADKYEKVYSLFIEEIKAALPNIKIVIIEPFLLKGEGTEKYFDEFFSEVKLRAAASKRIAEKYGLPFIPLQDKLSALAEKIGDFAVLRDGIHPNITGNALIADEVCKVLETLI